jgi:hypothetical protein
MALDKLTLKTFPKGLVVSTAAVTAVLYNVIRQVVHRLKTKPKGVKVVSSYWILGNVLDFLRCLVNKNLNDTLFKWRSEYGRTYAYSLSWMAPWHIVTSCPKNVEYVLKTNFRNYTKGVRFQSRLGELLGGGIFNSDGAEWQTQRKVSSPVFTTWNRLNGPRFIRGHIWIVVCRNASRLRNVLESADPEKPVDVFNLMNRFTLDTIGEIGFGKSIDSLGDPSSPFLLSFDRAQQLFFRRFIFPLWRICRWFNIGYEREAKMHVETLNTFTYKIVQELRMSSERSAADSAGKGRPSYVAWEDLEARKSFVGLFLEDAQKRCEELSLTLWGALRSGTGEPGRFPKRPK